MTTPNPDSRSAPAYELSFAPTAIHDAGAPVDSAPAAPNPERDAWIGPFGGERRNGRQSIALTPGHWKIVGASDFTPDLYPTEIATAGDRVLLNGASLWQLFDTAGHSIARGVIGRGGATMDAGRRCFVAADPTGPIKVWNLGDGAFRYAIEPYFGADFERAHVARHGDSLTIASIERVTDPHSSRIPKTTALEVQRIGESPAVTSIGLLERTDRIAKLMLSSAEVAIAGSSEGLVVASHDTIYFAGPDLRIHSALRGEFESLALSLDERDVVYLIGRQSARAFLWRLERDGRRLYDCELPGLSATDVTPPAVGLDHRAWVRDGARLTVVSPTGRVLATTTLSNPIAGLTLTPDGWALVTQGASILAMRPADRPGSTPAFDSHLLFTCPDGALTTPALLLADGRMVVGSSKKLYQLEASLQ